ncbi:MAG: YraN family protein [Bacteroidia bacterium]|nr:YraN family protein [Bacteroidia bacterium]
MEKKDTGDRGEELAAAYLLQKGYQILERNWRFKHLEIDIIAQQGDFIVIVEVKTRATREFGEPASFVNQKKKSHLIKAANFYAIEKNLQNEFRFDIVSVFVFGREAEIDHYEEAFYPLVNQIKI